MYNEGTGIPANVREYIILVSGGLYEAMRMYIQEQQYNKDEKYLIKDFNISMRRLIIIVNLN